ncbi:hypothetical protein TeGR_g469 [Tetraparma gracilis]|uniref:Uncharacterized protein n=1 Tax=Tetraparma gracilis TaxID=2962635 RepID=A0ABQ6MS10_9STRA|nr:hypothetical protein TeGR_g469 [Tetraparma gracilis]
MKHVARAWAPRLALLSRALLCATFLDDALRLALQPPGPMAMLGPVPLGAAAFQPFVGLVVELFGSLCLIALFRPGRASLALAAWSLLQPFLFGQLSNALLVSSSLSVVGGLLLVRASHVPTSPYAQLLGRLLIPAPYVCFAGWLLASSLELSETTSLPSYLADLSIFLVSFLAFLALLLGSALVALGLRSRKVALAAALANLAYAFHAHPFFLYASRCPDPVGCSRGWEYSDAMPFPAVSIPFPLTPADFTLAEIYDLHRCYFFLAVSCTGALLVLAQAGPGEIAAQKDEAILPTRAQD